ncbi:MAG TPA: hypothetical protein VNQ73_14960 [Ilumatobacter sp.]|nr:hypothetical protein [Ilumatobacter sp.]
MTVAAIAALVWALADPYADPVAETTLAQVGCASARAVRDLAAAVRAEFADDFAELPVVTLSTTMSVGAFAETMSVALRAAERSDSAVRRAGRADRADSDRNGPRSREGDDAR